MSTNYAPPLSSSDGTYAEAFPQFSVLRSVLLPPVDGVWANTAAAYETLPPLLGGLADQLWALRSNGYDHARPNVTAGEVDYRETVFESTNYETEHPVGQVYARTRERALVCGRCGDLGQSRDAERPVTHRARRDDRRAGVGRYRWPARHETQ